MTAAPPPDPGQATHTPPSLQPARRGLGLLLRLGLYSLFVVLLFGSVITALLVSRPHIEDWVLSYVESALTDTLSPTLRFEGPVEWQLHPVPVISLFQVSLLDQGQPLMQIERVTLKLDARTLRDGVVTVDSIEVIRPSIDLGANPAQWLSASAWLRQAETPPSAPTTAPPLVIRQIDIVDASAQAQWPQHELKGFSELKLSLHSSLLSFAFEPAPGLEPTLSAAFEIKGVLELTGLLPTETAQIAVKGHLDLKDHTLLTEGIHLSLEPTPSGAADQADTLLPTLSLQLSLSASMPEQQGSLHAKGSIDTTTVQAQLVWQNSPQSSGQQDQDSASDRPMQLWLELDRLDLDRWERRLQRLQTLKPVNAPEPETGTPDQASTQDNAGAHQAGAEADPPSSEPTRPPPWADWPIRADIRIQTLEKSPLLAQDVRIRINHPED